MYNREIAQPVQKQKKAKVYFAGTHIFTLAKVVSEKAQKIVAQIEACISKRAGLIGEEALHQNWLEYSYWQNQLNKFFKTQEIVIENLTTNAGRNVFARLLANDNTYSGNISHTALGDDPTAAAVTDTTLGNEVYRKALSSGSFLNQTAYIETFFTATEVDGTFEEFGNVIDGTGSADTGILFNRFTDTVTKSNVETLNVQSQIAMTDA